MSFSPQEISQLGTLAQLEATLYSGEHMQRLPYLNRDGLFEALLNEAGLVGAGSAWGGRWQEHLRLLQSEMNERDILSGCRRYLVRAKPVRRIEDADGDQA